uniref:Uncharacterized protein n=1 Tax=Arundo donax TaxID=35708 RepID=A0A0A9DZV7_ARUDO
MFFCLIKCSSIDARQPNWTVEGIWLCEIFITSRGYKLDSLMPIN